VGQGCERRGHRSFGAEEWMVARSLWRSLRLRSLCYSRFGLAEVSFGADNGACAADLLKID
jgi:hypothetical protein